MSERLWTPTAESVSRATLTRFGETVGRSGSYEELWQWSVNDLDGFWRAVVEFGEVDLGDGWSSEVLRSREMPGAEWFPGATVNYAEHAFRGRRADEVAIRHASEAREGLGVWTWGELRSQTARIAAGLAASGVGPGDRVCAYMPNIPETMACLLACASLGAVWSSAAPEFGARSVIDRFAQVEPTVLLAIDGYRYGGRDFDRSSEVEAVAAELPSSCRVVRFGYLDGSGWEDGFLGPADVGLAFERVAFDHPLWILFSSGTTGLPKPIVHSQGGILVEQVKHHLLHLDAQAGDRVFWFTTTGWMMWNWLVGVLLTPASAVLFDGNPGYPSLDRLWDLAAEAEITTLGVSAAFIAQCIKSEVPPRGDGRDLSSLRAVGSTGSPLAPEGFQWIYEQLGSDTWLFSTSGGTDVCTSFVGGVPTLPVYLGELQARMLGAAVESWSPSGESLVGEVGELVVTQPMPSMPIRLWGDEDGSRLRESYYEMYPGVWRHGDWIEFTERGTAIIHGRSDSTINRGGVRMGTSEIYRAVLAVDDVLDALVVDVPREGTSGWMPLFVVLRDGAVLDDVLVKAIRTRVRSDCSPRHVPDEIVQIAAVPRTLSGKVLEVPVKRILMGNGLTVWPRGSRWRTLRPWISSSAWGRDLGGSRLSGRVGRTQTLRLRTSQLAGRQWGHVTRAQLLGLGMTGAMIDRWVRDGKLVRIHQGVYALGYRRVEPVARAMAAVLACGGGAVLSHDSAAALWGLRRWPRTQEIMVTGDRRPKGIIVHRSVTLTRADRTVQLGVPTTTVHRTLTDLRHRLTTRQFARLVNQARLDHRLGTEAATDLLTAPAPLTRSELERDFIAWIARHGLPIPIMNTALHGFEVDALYPDLKVVIEIDDYETHGDPATFESDRERDAVHADHGYLPYRITRERFTTAEADRLRRILTSRAG